MKIRVLSDLHIDVNRGIKYKPIDDGVTTLIAGDIAGDIEFVLYLLNTYYKNTPVYFINGNHFVYHTSKEHQGESVQKTIKMYRKTFPIGSKHVFLENNAVDLDKNTILIGCTFWTDFEFYGEKEKDLKMAAYYMNDYRQGATFESKDNVELFRPQHTIKFHEESLEFIKQTCLKNPNKKIILMLHHGVSSKSISKKYVDSEYNAAYTSKLDEWLKQFKNIKLIIHGHVHDTMQYKVNKVPACCNALGYVVYSENKNFKDDLVFDTNKL